ncbi:hypothetical protein N7478_006714 [Penicillium angulare]|uniref:uncharacterized protein n=1 Tax=Penicillium angulare TaxID=116970 RepID=UPI00254080E3|nr:uncharacterized protein N7478_006714 [Penicillium angulare]KAJ5281342.1 hypothetical protein N7478_006714 [Penicillium angulare]
MSSQTNPTILLLGTCDTKIAELLYTKSSIEDQKVTVLLMDIGRVQSSDPNIMITQETILQHAPSQKVDMSSLPRDEYINFLTQPAIDTVQFLVKSGNIHGILGIGGSCGTALATAIMQSMPLGFPKLMVSTMASGDISPYIGSTDIAMMYSVVDIAGRNSVLDMVLRNAAGAVVGISRGYLERLQEKKEPIRSAPKVRVGISMFGVTTPGVTKAREHLEEFFGKQGCEIYVFHATGSGGRAMERLIEEVQLDAVLDMTTTEIADEVVGGVLSAGDKRLCAATSKDIPRVVSVGACDMVNFGPFETVPETWRGRMLHRHNPTVTVMRTTAEECKKIAKVIAKNLRGVGDNTEGQRSIAKTKVFLPVGGLSMLDVPGQLFWNPDADEVLFSTLEKELEGSGIEVIRDERDVNDPGFAKRLADELCSLILTERKY